MKTLFIVAVFCLGCSRDHFTPIPSNQDKIIGRLWKTYEFSRNGTVISAVANQEPTFELRNDSKMYFSQINPVFKDTFVFRFIDETNVQLTKPWINATDASNLRIDRLTDAQFDFTITNNKTPDKDAYKTQKQ
jgi:hypothetical protein